MSKEPNEPEITMEFTEPPWGEKDGIYTWPQKPDSKPQQDRQESGVSKRPNEHVRIERVVDPHGGGASIAKQDRYIFVAEDGTETEISRIMRGVELSAMAGSMWEATFRTPFIHLVEVAE